MRLSTLSTVTALLLTSIATVVSAQSEVPTCSSRLPPLERAQCLVKWHQQVMQELGRTQAPAQVVPLTASVIGPSGGSASAPRSCSRSYGVERAQCLVAQHKAVLQQIVAHPVIQMPPPPNTTPVKRVCTRYSDRTLRARCLAGETISLSSSSTTGTSSAGAASSVSSAASSGQ